MALPKRDSGSRKKKRPSSRSDAAQRTGARTPPAPRPPVQAKPIRDPFPLGLGAPAFKKQQKAQHRKTQKARKRIPADPRLPRFPELEEYTPSQRKAIVKRTRDTLEETGGARKTYEASNVDERRALRLVGELERQRQESQRRALGRMGGNTTPRPLLPAPKRSGVNRFATSLYNDAAFAVTRGAGAGLRDPLNLLRAVAFETPKAYVEGLPPGGKKSPLKGDAKFVLDTLAGVVKAPYLVATGQGDDLLEGIKDDYVQFYGPAVEGDFRRFRENVHEQGGLRVAADAIPVASGLLKGVGAAAKLRGGRLLNEPRARKRTGFGATRAQHDETLKLAPNPLRVIRQKHLDAHRNRRVEEQDIKARRRAAEEVGNEQRTAAGNRRAVRPAKPRVTGEELTRQGRAVRNIEKAGGRVVRDSRGRVRQVDVPRSAVDRIGPSLEAQGFVGRVTRQGKTYYPPRETVGLRRTGEKLAQRRDVAHLKGRGVSTLRRDGAEERKLFRAASKGLSKPERAAIFYAVTGLMSDSNPKAALAHLDEMEAEIRQTRGKGKRRSPLKPYEIDNLRDIAYLREHIGEAITPRLAERAAKLREQINRVEATNPLLDPDQAAQARVGMQAQILKAERKADEDTAAYVRRVEKAAKETGRPPAAFAPSQPFFEPRFADYAVGGTELPRPSRRRTYALMKKGRQRTDPAVIYDGIQRNVKQRTTANVVADTFNRHAHPEHQGLRIKDLKDAIRREGYDLSQVAIWMPDRFRTGLLAIGDQLEDARGKGRRTTDALEDDQHLDATLVEALRNSVAAVDDLDQLDALGDVRGSIVPRAVFDEIMAATKKEGAGARVLERIKTLQSRMILGTGNINWLIADTVANAAYTAFAGVGPITVLKSLSFYKRLPKELRDAWADELDVGGNRFQTHVPHIGSAVNSSWLNRWRAMRAMPGWKSATPLRTLIDAFLHAERTIASDGFRIAVSYKLLRNETFNRLDRNVGALNATMDRIAHAFTLGPEEQMTWLLKNQDVLEDNARLVNEALGDWRTLTNLERRTIGRVFFFYPYLRFATRMVFWTLPTQHPVKLSILAQIGELAEKEQRELVGVDESNPQDVRLARSLMFGRVFVKDDKSSTGFREYNVRTLNPLGNPLTEAEGTENALLALPPYAQWGLGQLTKMDVFRWQPWNVDGQKTPPVGRPDLSDPLKNIEVRAGVLLRQLLDLPPLTRELQRNALPGEQSSEANLLFGEEPLRYKTPERQRQADERRARDEAKPLGRLLLESNFRAFVGKESDILGQLDRRRQARNVKKPAAPRRVVRVTPDAEQEAIRALTESVTGGPALSDAELEALRALGP